MLNAEAEDVVVPIRFHDPYAGRTTHDKRMATFAGKATDQLSCFPEPTWRSNRKGRASGSHLMF